jgi:hypothetical protein
VSLSDAITEGFRLVNRTWQLVLVQLVMAVIQAVGFVVLVVVPVAAALLVNGAHLPEVRSLTDLAAAAGNPWELVSRFLWLFVVGLVSILLYLTFSFSVWLYVLGGSAGVLGQAVKDASFRFSMGSFTHWAKRLFVPLMGYTLLVGLLFIGLFLLGSVSAVAGFLALDRLAPHEGALGVFFRTFFILSALFFLFAFIFGLYLLSLEGIAPLALQGERPSRSLDSAFAFLKRQPRAVGLFALLALLYIGAQFALVLVGIPLQFVPFVGIILAIPYQFLSLAVQAYLCLVILGSVMLFYHRGTSPPAQEPSASGSSPATGTSPVQGHGPASALPPWEEQAEGPGPIPPQNPDEERP